MLSMNAFMGALELGCIYALVALAIAGPYMQKKHSAGRRRRQLSAAGEGRE